MEAARLHAKDGTAPAEQASEGIPAATPLTCEPGEFAATQRDSYASRPLDVVALIVDVRISGGDAIITVGAGANANLDDGWTGVLLDRHHRPVRSGAFTVICTTRIFSLGRMALGATAVRGQKVRLFAPP